MRVSQLVVVAVSLAVASPVRADRDQDDVDDDAGAEADGAPDREPGRERDEPGASDVALGAVTGVALPAPPIGEVLEAAYQAAGLDRDPSGNWNRRARLAGLIPWLSVRLGRDTSWTDLEPAIDHGTTVEVRATWRLDRLLFDGRELQVATIDTARRRERRRLASRVIRSYFTWRRLAEAALRQPRFAIRAEEAAAELDSLTDGWFGDDLTRRGASETRTR